MLIRTVIMERAQVRVMLSGTPEGLNEEVEYYARNGYSIVDVFERAGCTIYVFQDPPRAHTGTPGATRQSAVHSAHEVGDTVTIYSDPVTEARAEGRAVLVRLLSTTAQLRGAWHMERWRVHFLGDAPKATVERDLRSDSPLARPAAQS